MRGHAPDCVLGNDSQRPTTHRLPLCPKLGKEPRDFGCHAHSYYRTTRGGARFSDGRGGGTQPTSERQRYRNIRLTEVKLMCHAGMERKRGWGVGRDGCALSVAQYDGPPPNGAAASYGAFFRVLQSELINRSLNNEVRTESGPLLPCSDIANGHRVACIN